MSDYDSDIPSENEWEENGDLVWNEFDWEVYLREQDEEILKYMAVYDALAAGPERIDEAADKMGWDRGLPDDSEERESVDKVRFSDEIYTLQKNPVYVATKAIFRSLRKLWIPLASNSRQIPQPLAIGFLSTLHACEEQAVLAIHALDFGDYAMAVCLFKRAFAAMNDCFAKISSDGAGVPPALIACREDLRARIFDLREIWLRVVSDCREDASGQVEDDD